MDVMLKKKPTDDDGVKPDKKGFDMREHMSLRIDAIAADEYQKKNARGKLKNSTSMPKTLPVGILQLMKKVREIYDEDEEDENSYTYTFQQMPTIENESENENRLLFGLNDEEKRMVKQNETLENIKSQQTAGKMEALHVAHNLNKDVGMGNISKKVVSKEMQRATFDPEKMQKKVIDKTVTSKLGIKGNIDNGKIIQAARGIKKIENMGGQEAAKNLDMKDVIKAGEQKLDDIKLAELILQKSGQDVTKRKKNLKKSQEKIKLDNLEGKSKDKEKEDRPKKMNIKIDDFSR